MNDTREGEGEAGKREILIHWVSPLLCSILSWGLWEHGGREWSSVRLFPLAFRSLEPVGGFLGLEGCRGVSGVLLVRVCVCGDQIKGAGASWQLGFRRLESSASAHPHLTRSSINLTAHPTDPQLREVLGRGRDYVTPGAAVPLEQDPQRDWKTEFLEAATSGQPIFLND